MKIQKDILSRILNLIEMLLMIMLILTAAIFVTRIDTVKFFVAAVIVISIILKRN